MSSETTLSRFSVSMPSDLLRRFDRLANERGYANRSQALADLIRTELVEHGGQEARKEIAATITLVYDHHKRNLQAQLTNLQHDHPGILLSVLHVHLDHHNCMEVLALRGPAREIRSLADALRTVKGVTHATLTVTTTGKQFLAHRHGKKKHPHEE